VFRVLLIWLEFSALWFDCTSTFDDEQSRSKL